MISVIERIDQVTTEWLTNALRESGYLQQGEVDAFSKHQSHLEGFTSERYHFGPDFTKYRLDPDTPFPLTRSECEEAIECLATVHASWWNNPQLGNEVGHRPTKESSSQLFKYLEECMVSN